MVVALYRLQLDFLQWGSLCGAVIVGAAQSR